MKIVKLTSQPLLGMVSLGGGYYDCNDGVELPADAVVVSEGADRYANLGTHRDSVLVATVFRAKDGTSLLSKANNAVAGSLGSKVPATGNTSAAPPAAAKAEDVLTKAKEYFIDGSAHGLRVKQVEVLSGDVVEQDLMVPHRWFGEGV